MTSSIFRSITSRERLILMSVGILLISTIAWTAFGPPIPASAIPVPHDFADHRAWGALPNALDVVSNLPFALFGGLGLLMLAKRLRPLVSMQPSTSPVFSRSCAALFFGGLLCSAAGSAWYHLHLDDASLLFDRLGMAVAFAGLVGLAAADRVSDRSGSFVAMSWLAGGLFAAMLWSVTSDVRPWVVVQFGGMAMVLALACLRALPTAQNGRATLPLFSIIAIYVMAKVFEVQDHEVFRATEGLVSGHTLKHLFASFAALPLLHFMYRESRPLHGHNASISSKASLRVDA